MTTIKDIAKAAKVSPATVSRILKNDLNLHVNPDTRARVLATADQLNYQTKSSKRSNFGKEIAILNLYRKNATTSELYFRSIIWGIETTLKNAGYGVSHLDLEEEIPHSKNFQAFIAVGYSSDQHLLQVKQLGKPLVVISHDSLALNISCVTVDYTNSILSLLSHLENLGHKRIGLLAGTSPSQVNRMDSRTRAYIQFQTERQTLDENLIFHGDFSMESGYQAMSQAIQKLQDQLPTAIIASSDTMAVGALRALTEHHIPVPDQVQLVGFGDLELGQYLSPSLSTIQPATRQMGITGALTIINLLSGIQTTPVNIVTGTRYISRETCP